jgi:competence protein CoiA
MASKMDVQPRNKSRTHNALQKHIVDLLWQFPVEMEKRFSSIDRIGDVVWEEKKLVFEIQCSPMSRQEMLERTQAYRSLGYQVVWILHERSYNQYKLTALEGSILEIPHYFSNFTPGGEGMIYDQCCFISKGARVKTFHRIPVDLSHPEPITPPMKLNTCPRLMEVKRRLNHWPIYFENDLVSLDQKAPQGNSYQTYLEQEQVYKEKKVTVWAFIKQTYMQWLNRALKDHCG